MSTLICFDCDGVLVDSEPLAAQAAADLLSELGINMSWQEANALFTGKTAEAAHQTVRDTYGVNLPASYQSNFEDLVLRRFQDRLQSVDGIAGVLEALDAPTCVTSNSSHRRVALSLGVTGLLRHFDTRVFSAEDVDHGKPAPDLFFHAARVLGADIGKAIVIDDSVTGITGAVAAGAQAIGFTAAGHIQPGHAERLRAAGASDIAASAPELLELLRTALSQSTAPA